MHIYESQCLPLVHHYQPLFQPNQYPWMVRLTIRMIKDGKWGTYHCGGTLVASKYIITAAHCMVGDRGKVRESNIKVWI